MLGAGADIGNDKTKCKKIYPLFWFAAFSCVADRSAIEKYGSDPDGIILYIELLLLCCLCNRYFYKTCSKLLSAFDASILGVHYGSTVFPANGMGSGVHYTVIDRTPLGRRTIFASVLDQSQRLGWSRCKIHGNCRIIFGRMERPACDANWIHSNGSNRSCTYGFKKNRPEGYDSNAAVSKYRHLFGDAASLTFWEARK